MAIPNPLEAVVDFLLNDAGVVDLVSTRVYFAELPRADTKLAPRAAVVVSASGGGGTGAGDRSFIPLTKMRMDVRAYAATPYACWAIHLAVLDALKNLSRAVETATLLHCATVTGGPLQLRDGDLDWPLVLSVYDVIVAEVAIP